MRSTATIRGSLRAKRRVRQRRAAVIAGFVVLVLIAAAFYGLWQPGVRVTHVEAAGAHVDALRALSLSAITGTYGHIVPRDSIFFIPKDSVRTAILDAYPDVSAVSVSRRGLNGIAVTAVPRVSAFSWCGPERDAPTGACYEVDAEGLVFEVDPSPTSALRIYAPITDAVGDAYPLRSHVVTPEVIPGALRFVRTIESLGAEIESFQIHGDEADLYLPSGTRLTYVLGHEEAAAQLAAAAFPSLNLTDGSIDYVDLRFSGKVYVKKVGE